MFFRWRSIAAWEFTATSPGKVYDYRIFSQVTQEFVDLESNWILSTYFGMIWVKSTFLFGGVKSWWQTSHQGFQPIFAGICHLSTGIYCWGSGAGQPGHWKYRSRAHIVWQAQLGRFLQHIIEIWTLQEPVRTRPMKSCVPPVPLIAAWPCCWVHLEAAAGYGPVAVYAELLVSWHWDRVCMSTLKTDTVRCSTHRWDAAIYFCQEFYKLIWDAEGTTSIIYVEFWILHWGFFLSMPLFYSTSSF